MNFSPHCHSSRLRKQVTSNKIPMMKTCQSSIKQSTQQKGKKKRVHDEKSQVQAIDESSKEGGSLRGGGHVSKSSTLVRNPLCSIT
jgi:hypothetical protein